MMRHFVGWTPPPHPIDVPPSIDSSLSRGEMAKRVLLDFDHDDDLRAAVYTGPRSTESPEGTNWLIGGHGPVNGTDLYQAFLKPSAFAVANSVSLPVLQSFLSALTTGPNSPLQKAIAKRLKLGPLPANDYSGDPIVIYYYDNDRIKKISYPRSAISTSSGYALDPNNHYWWKGNGISTQQRATDGTWEDEGFDWSKDAEGALTSIGVAIMAIVGVVLTATGVGSVAGAAILAFSAALVAEAQMIALGLTNGDWARFVGGFIDAITKLIGVEASGILPASVTKASLALLNSTLKNLSRFSFAFQAQDFKTAYAQVQAQLGSFGPVTDNQISAIDAMLGSAKQPFDAGYEIASYADPDEITGVIGIIPDQGAKSLFQLGATLGMIRKNQKASGNALLTGGPPQTPVSQQAVETQAQARADLLGYVQGTLRPRYGLPF